MSPKIMFLLFSIFTMGCSTKYYKGKEALDSCSFAPIESWLTPKPYSILCMEDVSMAPQPERVVIHTKNVPSLFTKGKKLNNVSEDTYIGTCYLLKYAHVETRKELMQELLENNIKVPARDYSYEVWTDVRILDGWLPQNYVEVIRSGEDAWIYTTLCSPS